MSDDPIDAKIAAIALNEVGTSDFERFGQSFYSEVEGLDFVPLGGAGDGGADGLIDRSVFESSDQSRVLQISKQVGTRAKVNATIERLKEFGRTPASLTYLTSQSVQNLDQEEDYLSERHGIRVRIRDRRYIESHVNHSVGTRQAARTFLLPAAAFLNDLGSRPIISASDQLPAVALCAFVGQEIDNRRGNSALLESVTDSLILWALNDTDPEQGVFKTRQQLLTDIETALPAARTFIRGVFDNRLEKLSEKSGTVGRKINKYNKEDKFCLPFETRQLVALETADDLGLKQRVTDIFKIRLLKYFPETQERLFEDILRVCHNSIEITFEKKGLELVKFISDTESGDNNFTLDDFVVKSIESITDFSGSEFQLVRSICLEILRGAFYESEPDERIYFQKLSRTYTFLFIIKNEPRVVEYFQSMTAQFVLYIGSDILIRAISEYFLESEDQMTVNLLKILSASGSKLVLTEKTIDEIGGNIRKANNIYHHDVLPYEQFMKPDIARNINHILIRAYFYAKQTSSNIKLSGWKDYVNQFADYDEIVRRKNDSLREYLCKKFNLEYETISDMEKGVDTAELTELTSEVMRVKKYPPQDEALAYNDALQVLRIYDRRRASGDRPSANPLGFRVWWLTQESKIKGATGATVKKNGGRYLMRPEFLLSFLDVLPSLDEVRKSFGSIFPTILGIRLSNRISEGDFAGFLKKYSDLAGVDPARAEVMLASYSNRLKSDSSRDYEVKFRSVV